MLLWLHELHCLIISGLSSKQVHQQVQWQLHSTARYATSGFALQTLKVQVTGHDRTCDLNTETLVFTYAHSLAGKCTALKQYNRMTAQAAVRSWAHHSGQRGPSGDQWHCQWDPCQSPKPGRRSPTQPAFPTWHCAPGQECLYLQTLQSLMALHTIVIPTCGAEHKLLHVVAMC